MLEVRRFSLESYRPTRNAQINLQGRTHYVDPDTLKYHKSRVLQARVEADGLLFSIIESVAADYENKTRGFRPVVFDLFGNVVFHVPLEQLFRTRNRATKALNNFLGEVDAKVLNRVALQRYATSHAQMLAELRASLWEG